MSALKTMSEGVRSAACSSSFDACADTASPITSANGRREPLPEARLSISCLTASRSIASVSRSRRIRARSRCRLMADCSADPPLVDCRGSSADCHLRSASTNSVRPNRPVTTSSWGIRVSKKSPDSRSRPRSRRPSIS